MMKDRLRRLFNPAIRGLPSSSSWHRRRLLGTAAARPVMADGRSKKRMSREERKSMVEAFVSKYRMENGGKFPTVCGTQKQVGGGYYVVRGILQELEYNSKMLTVRRTDEKPAHTEKFDGNRPLSSKEINGVSEVGKGLNSEALVGTTSVSDEYGIEAENGSISGGEVSENYGSGEGSSITGCTVKDKRISGISEVLDAEVVVGTTVVSESCRMSADDGASTEGKLHNNGGEGVMDESIGLRNELSIEVEDSKVGQTAKVNGISEVREVLDGKGIADTSSVSNNYRISTADGSSSQSQLSDNNGHMMMGASMLNNEVATTDENSTVSQTDKTNRTCEVRGVADSDVFLGKSIDTNNPQVPADDVPNSKEEASKHSSQTMMDKSIVTNYSEVSAKDETSIVGQTVKAISEEKSEFLSKPGHPSEVPGASKNTELRKLEVAPSQASESNQLTWKETQNEPKEASVWHNLKSFASSIIGIWWK